MSKEDYNQSHKKNSSNISEAQPKLKLLYTNCDSYPNKEKEMKIRIGEDNPDIIMLTEVLPKKSMTSLSIDPT